MQRDENEDPEEFEREDSIGELCRPPRVRRKKGDKLARTVVENMFDRLKRDEAQKTAAVQDAERRHVPDNRFAVNAYAGGAAVIRDLCLVKKKKVR